MTQPFTAASHHDVLVLLVQLAVLLLTARLMGEVAQRLNQPTVVGELLAGILLGPSLLSGLFPALGEWIVPHTPVQGYLLETISLLGAMFMLLMTGLETDLSLIRRQARSAVGASLGGLIVPLLTGFGLGMIIPNELLVDPQRRLVFAMFIATAMSISAIPVIAKVLFDLGLMRRDIGQTIIASGMADDTAGWILLSVVVGLAAGEAITVNSVLFSVGKVAVFMVLSFTAGRWLVARALRFVQNEVTVRERLLSLVMVLTFVWAALAQALDLEAVLGAFVMGILFSVTRGLSSDIIHTIERVGFGVFVPIFFAVAGLKVNIANLLRPDLLLIGLLVIGVASFGKIVGTYLGARLIGGRDHWTALAFGAGLNARGAMEIIIATIGLSLGILTQDMFSIIVVMAMATSLMAPTMLRWVLRHIQPGEAELARLRQEQLAEGSLLAHVRRVLLPVRVRTDTDSGTAQRIEARLLERLNARSELSVTLMSVSKPDQRTVSQKYLDRLGGLFAAAPVAKKVAVGDNIGKLILDEAQKDYDLMVLGASENGKSTEVLFSPIIDSLMRSSPCPTLLVQGGDLPADWAPRRIVVASNGSAASRRAAEIAFALACQPDDEVQIVQVVERTMADYQLDAEQKIFDRHMQTAQRSVDALRELGQLKGVQTTAEVRPGREPEKVILSAAKSWGADLIVLGTSISVGSDRLYLGPRVERILANAPCPVVVINA
jgi:Kef-type K+ transport system membrane component KefB/nucleotide-binding universal stress UspA family protein